ncbi:MAG: CvpA family protein [Fretibacterium sp.]|nr:CvpA family protein [Fretibacterium sp.]
MSFAWIFDIAMGCVLAFFLVRGALRGLTGEIFSLLGLLAGIFFGWTFARPAAELILGFFPSWDPTITELLCSIAIFIGASLVFALLGGLVGLLVKAARLSFMDHLLGAGMGVLKACCLVLFIYGVVSIFPTLIPSDWMKESYAMRGAAVVWPPVRSFMEERNWLDLSPLRGPGPERREGSFPEEPKPESSEPLPRARKVEA